jgi:hypothetical protein
MSFPRGQVDLRSAESPNRFPGFINTTFESSLIPDGVAATLEARAIAITEIKELKSVHPDTDAK